MPERNIVLIAAAVAALLLLAGVVAWSSARRRRRQQLADRYGAHFDRAVEQHGGAAQAEKELKLREKRFEKASIRDLSAADRERYSGLCRALFDDLLAGELVGTR